VDLDLIVKLVFGDGLWQGKDPTAAVKQIKSPIKPQVSAL
jgi:hypothetical protein